MHPACTGRKTGGSFVTGREQKACPFSESGGRYISPRPSSFVPRRAGTKCPKGGGSRAPKIKRGGQAPSGLARLDDRKARPGGAVNGGAPAPFILTIDGPGWDCYPANLSPPTRPCAPPTRLGSRGLWGRVWAKSVITQQQ